MSSDDAARYREQAEYCRHQSKMANKPKDKEAWLKVAGDWLNMAEDAEARQDRPKIPN
jgi:hypothetical protein